MGAGGVGSRRVVRSSETLGERRGCTTSIPEELRTVDAGRTPGAQLQSNDGTRARAAVSMHWGGLWLCIPRAEEAHDDSNPGLVGFMAAIAACGCSGDGGTSGTSGTSSPSTGVAVEHVVVRGHATLDGAPFDAEFLGAAVRDHGLVTPCQSTLPRVERGLYVVEVLSDAVASGCGVPGSEILLWTFTGNTQYFSTAALPWPADGRPTTFDASFIDRGAEGCRAADDRVRG